MASQSAQTTVDARCECDSASILFRFRDTMNWYGARCDRYCSAAPNMRTLKTDRPLVDSTRAIGAFKEQVSEYYDLINDLACLGKIKFKTPGRNPREVPYSELLASLSKDGGLKVDIYCAECNTRVDALQPR